MKRLQPFVFSAALLFLAACGQDAQPAATPSFNFSVDPAAGSVNLTSADAQTLKTLQIGECGSGQPRTLFAGEELALTSYDAAFLPGNLLQITAEFTNVTDFSYEQPFTFTQAPSTSNIVSSQEPEVTDADLGGDGALSPDETTSALTFTVEHKGQPFTYEVLAEAVVNCGDEDPGDPGDTSGADLEVTKTGDTEVVTDADGDATLNYSVVVTNNGDAVAEGTELTDTFTIDLSALDGAGEVTATVLPDECIIDADASVGGTEVATCTLGALEAGGSTTLDFSFTVDLPADVAPDSSFPVTNTADATTTTDEDDLTNNGATVDSTVNVPAAVPAVADLTVTKTGDATVTTDANGNATLNYTVVVTNNGDATADGTELTDNFNITLPASGGDVTANLPAGCVLDPALSVGGAQVATCTLGALASGESSTLDFSYDVALPGAPAGTSVPATNAADATTTTDENDLTNNGATVDSTVNVPAAVPAVADLAVTKTGDATAETDANGDATLNYSVIVTNNGDAIAEGTELTDTFTIDLSALDGAGEVTATVLPDECIIDADASVGGTEVATCTLGALEAGGSTTLDFSFTVDLPAEVAPDSSFPVTNTADATTTTDEDDLTNNGAAVNSTVTVPAPLP